MTTTYPMFLAGDWIENDHPLDVTSPYDDAIVGRTYLAQPAELERAIEAAAGVTQELQSVPTWQRAEWLQNLANAMTDHREELVRIIALECGKPIRDANAEFDRGVFTVQYAAEEAKRLTGQWLPLDLMPASNGKSGIVRRFPIGPVAAISPFNFPLNLALHKVAPAIAVGAPIILKPPTAAPLTMLFVARLLSELGMPKGSVSVLPMSRETGDRMVEDDRFSMLSFTGSPSVGWKMKSRAGKKKVVLELGGNAGVLVDDDANVDYAIGRIVTGAFSYAGQVCISVQRVFAHESVYDRVRDGIIAGANALVVGDPMSETTALGPMVDDKAVKRISDWVDEAVARGGRLLAGGRADGRFFPATVLEYVPRDATLCMEEAFAPVVLLEKVSSFEQGLEALNDSVFGLQAGVFTNRLEHSLLAFEKLDVGGVVVNDIPTYRIDHMPYGGVKDSGLGREGIRWTMEEMTEERLLVINRIPEH